MSEKEKFGPANLAEATGNWATPSEDPEGLAKTIKAIKDRSHLPPKLLHEDMFEVGPDGKFHIVLNKIDERIVGQTGSTEGAKSGSLEDAVRSMKTTSAQEVPAPAGVSGNRIEPFLDPQAPIDETEPKRVSPKQENNPVFDRAKETAGAAWKNLSEGAQKFLGELYENVKNSDPVQNALDRLKAFRSGEAQSRMERKLASLESRHAQSRATLEEYAAQAQKVTSDVAHLHETLREVDIPLSQQSLQEMSTQAAVYDTLREKQEKRVQADKTRADAVRIKFESWRTKTEASQERVNARLSAKQEVHGKEIATLEGLNATLESSAAATKKEIENLEKAFSSLAEIQKGLGKAAARGYDVALEQVEQKRGELLAVLAPQLKMIESHKARMSELKEKQDQLEEKKLGKKKEETRNLPEEPQTGNLPEDSRKATEDTATYEWVSPHQLLRDFYKKTGKGPIKEEEEKISEEKAPEVVPGAESAPVSEITPTEGRAAETGEEREETPQEPAEETEGVKQERSPQKLARRFEEQIRRHLGKKFFLKPESFTLESGKKNGPRLGPKSKDALVVTLRGSDGVRYQVTGKLGEKDSKLTRLSSKLLT